MASFTGIMLGVGVCFYSLVTKNYEPLLTTVSMGFGGAATLKTYDHINKIEKRQKRDIRAALPEYSATLSHDLLDLPDRVNGAGKEFHGALTSEEKVYLLEAVEHEAAAHKEELGYALKHLYAVGNYVQRSLPGVKLLHLLENK